MNSSRCDRVLAAPPPRATHARAHLLFTKPLQDKELASHRLVLYSSDDPRRKANAALLMALYVVTICPVLASSDDPEYTFL